MLVKAASPRPNFAGGILECSAFRGIITILGLMCRHTVQIIEVSRLPYRVRLNRLVVGVEIAFSTTHGQHPFPGMPVTCSSLALYHSSGRLCAGVEVIASSLTRQRQRHDAEKPAHWWQRVPGFCLGFRCSAVPVLRWGLWLGGPCLAAGLYFPRKVVVLPH